MRSVAPARRQGQRGFALLLVFAMAAAVALMLSAEQPRAVIERRILVASDGKPLKPPCRWVRIGFSGVELLDMQFPQSRAQQTEEPVA